MPHLFAGFSGIAVGLGIPAIVALVVYRRSKDTRIDFDLQGERGSFEKLLPIYLRFAEFVLGLGAGSIVLLVGSSAFRAGGRLPWVFASPLYLLALSVVYGIIFMLCLILDYDNYRNNPSFTPYTRAKYTRTHALAFGALICFCLGYAWLVFATSR